MRKITAFICVFLIVGTMVFAGGGGERAAGERLTSPVTFRLAHVYNPGHPWDVGAHLAADIVRERTNGMIDIQVYPSSQLGTEEQVLEAAVLGSIEIVQSGGAQIGNLFRAFNVFEMPYTFRDNDHVLLFAKTDMAKRMYDDLEKEFGVTVLTTSSFGVRQLTSNRPITTPADLRGFKLRVPEQQITMAYARAMGADPTPIALAEAYMALQQNVVDGLENPLSSIFNMRFHEVQRYINLTSHVTNANFFVMNSRVYHGLHPHYQAILHEAFDAAAIRIVEILNDDDRRLGETFRQAGVTVHQPDLEAFRRATAGMPEEFRSWWSAYGADLHSRIQNLR